MELSPIRLHTRPNSVATFTCAYQAHLPLNITFHMLGLAATRTRVVQSMARVRREEEGVEEMFPWSGSRQWRVEVDGGQSVVVCSLVGPNNRTLGRLHALVTTDTEHTDECSDIGECTVGGKRSCIFIALPFFNHIARFALSVHLSQIWSNYNPALVV